MNRTIMLLHDFYVQDSCLISPRNSAPLPRSCRYREVFLLSVNAIGLHITSSIRHPIISMLRARTCRKIPGKGQIQNVVITTSTT